MRILITGGTGTFGQMAAQQFLNRGDTVTVYSRDEMKQEAMEREFDNPRLRCFLGDVRDLERLTLACRSQDVLIHAAALKIVPRCEFDPFEAVKTNVGGTENAIKAVLATDVSKCVFINTDKAVDPINLYGATKKVAEHMWLAANNYARDSRPAFSAVRYGNVWGSRGSVVPFWNKCVEEGKPLPVTDPEMTRFFMLPDEAVELVNYAIDNMKGTEVFIPRLKAYSVRGLLGAFKLLYPGYTSSNIGIRSGEKLHERMASEYELPSIAGYDPFILSSNNLVKIPCTEWGALASNSTYQMSVHDIVKHLGDLK